MFMYKRDKVGIHRPPWISKVNTKLSHSTDDSHQTLDCVAVHYWTILLTFFH